jgi:hypothetical protein
MTIAELDGPPIQKLVCVQIGSAFITLENPSKR